MSELIEKVRNGIPFHDELLIDVHNHCGFMRQAYVPFNTLDEITANMERLGIDRACICTMPAASVGDPFRQNEYVANWVNARPDKFTGYVTINGNYKDDALKTLKTYEKMGLTLGIKMHTYRQNYSITDEFLYPVYESLNKRGAWFLHHDFGPAAGLEQLLRDFPNITFIQGHAGTHYKKLYEKYDNMYGCTCAGMNYDSITGMIKTLGADRVLLGSDFIALDTSFGYGPVVYARVTDEEKRKVMGLNAKRLMAKVLPPSDEA